MVAIAMLYTLIHPLIIIFTGKTKFDVIKAFSRNKRFIGISKMNKF